MRYQLARRLALWLCVCLLALTGGYFIFQWYAPRGDEAYGFSLLGVPITSQNYDRLSEAGFFPQLLRGRMSYDPSDGCLRLDSVLLDGQEADSASVLEVYEDCVLELAVRGECRIVSARESAVRVRGYLRVVGRNILTVESQLGAAIELDGGTLEVTDISYLDAWSGWCAITGTGSPSSRLVVDGATVRAHVLPVRNGKYRPGDPMYAIGELGWLECQGAGILDRDMTFELGAVRYAATGVLAKHVLVTPFLGFYIGRVPVTYGNYKYLGDPYVLPSLRRGVVSYDLARHVLRLEDAYLASEDGFYGLYCQDADGLRVELAGENTIVSTGGHAMLVQDSVSIVGDDGMLTCRARGGGSGIMLLPGSRLLVEDCHLSTRGEYGLEGRYGATLLLRNAALCAEGVAVAEGGDGGVVPGGSVVLDSLNLLDGRTALALPRGAHFARGRGVVWPDGEPVREGVQFVLVADCGEPGQ